MVSERRPGHRLIWRAMAVTKDTRRGIHGFLGLHEQHSRHPRQDGETKIIIAHQIRIGRDHDLTPIEKIAAQIEGVSERFPEEILVGINDRGQRRYHDVHRVNIVTGERKLIQENPGFDGFLTDDDFRVRFAMQTQPDASQQLLKPAAEGKWELAIKIPSQDAMTTGPAGFDKTGEHLYFIDSRERNTAALRRSI
jgi:hypothetical protein